MGLGKHVSDFERGQIKILSERGESTRKIAKAIGRSKCLVRSCLKRGVDTLPGRGPGRQRKLTERDERHIINLASNSTIFAEQIIDELQLNVSSSTVLRVLKRCPHIQREKMAAKPAITTSTINKRLQWGINHADWVLEWFRLIFSDEKKFNLDGPDGYAYYWHDLRKDKRIFSQRKFGGGSLIVWIGFTYDHKSQLYVFDGDIDAASYQNMLNTVLIPLVALYEQINQERPIFQHDLAPPHTAASTMTWLQEHNIDLMPWIPSSPDMNIAENIFGKIARDVYGSARQYHSVEELRDAIKLSWDSLDQEFIQNLYILMPNRVNELVKNMGKSTSY